MSCLSNFIPNEIGSGALPAMARNHSGRSTQRYALYTSPLSAPAESGEIRQNQTVTQNFGNGFSVTNINL